MYDNNPMSSLVLFVALRELGARNTSRRRVEKPGLVRAMLNSIGRWFAAPKSADVTTVDPAPAPAKADRPRPAMRVKPSIPAAFALPDRPSTQRKETVSAAK